MSNVVSEEDIERFVEKLSDELLDTKRMGIFPTLIGLCILRVILSFVVFIVTSPLHTMYYIIPSLYCWSLGFVK